MLDGVYAAAGYENQPKAGGGRGNEIFLGSLFSSTKYKKTQDVHTQLNAVGGLPCSTKEDFSTVTRGARHATFR